MRCDFCDSILWPKNRSGKCRECLMILEVDPHFLVPSSEISGKRSHWPSQKRRLEVSPIAS